MPETPAFILHGHATASIVVPLATIPQTPRTPAGRLEQAVREALPIALALHRRAVEQEGADPVMVICAVDSALGRQLVERAFGPALPHAVTGPVVLSASQEALVQAFGPQNAQRISKELEGLEAAPGDVRIALAVNGASLDLRVLRGGAPAAPAGGAQAS